MKEKKVQKAKKKKGRKCDDQAPESFVTTYPLIADALTFILKETKNFKMLKIETFPFKNYTCYIHNVKT